MSIEVRNVSFAYLRGKTVLDNISFQIPDGEFVCLLGPNGVGKSTLFKCILRLLTSYSGEIFVDGTDSGSLSAKELSRRVAYIPQSAAAIFNYTVRDTVLMGTTAMTNGLRSPGKKEEAFVDQALKLLDIEYLKDRMFTRISGGERQLVLIARALAQQARILLMDEPTANLDYGNQLRVLEQIKTLSASGYTILESTHNPEQAFWYADRVLAVHGGKLIADGKPAEVMDALPDRRQHRIALRRQSPRLPAEKAPAVSRSFFLFDTDIRSAVFSVFFPKGSLRCLSCFFQRDPFGFGDAREVLVFDLLALCAVAFRAFDPDRAPFRLPALAFPRKDIAFRFD